MPNPFEKPSKTKRFLNVLKIVFLTRIPMNLLLLVLIVGLSVFGFQQLKPMQTPTGQATLEQECPECVCEEKQTQQECEQDCRLCPIKTKIETMEVVKYKCPGGDLVDDLGECTKNIPGVSEEYSGTVGGVTISIDNIEYEKDEEDSGFVTSIDYTIINKGEFPLVPKIQVKVYEEWSLKVKKEPANKIIDPEIVVNPNDYTKRKDRVRIYFKGEQQTVRLLLEDTLPDPDTEVLAVTRDFSLND